MSSPKSPKSPASVSSSSSSSSSASAAVSPYEHRAPIASLASDRPQPRTQSAPSGRRKAKSGHRKRHRTRRSSVIEETPDDDMSAPNDIERPPLTAASVRSGRRGSTFYLQQNTSDTSIDSQALLDHREQLSMRPRRLSTAGTRGPPTGQISSSFQRTATVPIIDTSALARGSTPRQRRRSQLAWSYREGANEDVNGRGDGDSSDGDASPLTERTPLFRARRNSRPSTSSDRGARTFTMEPSSLVPRDFGSVNNPPSVPASPRMDPLPLVPPAHDDFDLSMGPGRGRGGDRDRDVIINIDEDAIDDQAFLSGSPPSPHRIGPLLRPSTQGAEEDVCFPVDDGLDDEVTTIHGGHYQTTRRRARDWPELTILEEWSREEKEERSEGIRAKKMPEPVYVGGRLRPPLRSQWTRDELESPYRFTYFNEDLPATIHSHTISELLQPGQTFKDLFRPEPKVLEDSSDDESEHPSMHPSVAPSVPSERAESRVSDRGEHHNGTTPPEPSASLPRLGARPTFWLDVLSPTDAEMKALSKAFGIHPLTVEDIMMQETREKVELFRSYYLVSYRTFEHDSRSEDFLEPVNIYVVVFREGVISFHFSMTPHPANVRRRIRQLKDYITVSADWISYALIDDITDAFAPLIQALETEVDDIDDAILRMHLSHASSSSSPSSAPPESSHQSDARSTLTDSAEKSDGEMLKRVGDARRKVMGLYRLMGNKADVIKGFAKRCNEQWEVAPRSEIGLYLGDIQDHIVTMVGNLNHMEKILSRSHSNYLAQINIKMNERQEQTADVLGRLTVLGTIVLPMNIITGLWGMNVMVPGQEIENLNWFWCITAGLVVFGTMCYLVAKRVYKIM